MLECAYLNKPWNDAQFLVVACVSLEWHLAASDKMCSVELPQQAIGSVLETES